MIRQFLDDHAQLAGWLIAASVVMLVVSAVTVPWVLVRLPADYFVSRRPLPPELARRHPVIRWALRVLKNLAGLVLLFAGLLMTVTPGQGLLGILLGLSLMEFPGKRRLERWLILRPPVHKAINWLRRKGGAPPLVLPAEPAG
jgi:hypothetical protein